MANQRLTNMQRHAAKKDGEQRDEFCILHKTQPEWGFLDTCAVEEADEEVVEQSEEPGGADGVVCADVGEDCNFGGEGHGGGEEGAEEEGERAGGGPVFEWVEDEFVAAVGISILIFIVNHTNSEDFDVLGGS
ncbi:hypothetical protein IAQ61_003173 [Plenodomus lingam]|uniref:uncharacterized protein n=1 Tax=Leptosphaeria maculans TaxID=5022 RepID=UPI00331CE109|nr:hypothetical protein IAQ61_003173 [Plenodomus lingam]